MSSLLSVSEGVGTSNVDGGGVGPNVALGTGLNNTGGGTGTKRMRTTRAALSALEGGERSVKRKERWFRGELNPFLVEKTGGRGWTDLTLQYLADFHHSGNAVAEGEEEMKTAGSVSGASEVSVPWEAQHKVVSDVAPVQPGIVQTAKPKRGRPRKNMARVVEVDEAAQPDELAEPLAGVTGGEQGVDELAGEATDVATVAVAADDGDVSMTQ